MEDSEMADGQSVRLQDAGTDGRGDPVAGR